MNLKSDSFGYWRLKVTQTSCFSCIRYTAPSLLKPFIFIVFEGLKQIESINKFNIYTLNRVDGKQIYDHPFTILEALSLS